MTDSAHKAIITCLVAVALIGCEEEQASDIDINLMLRDRFGQESTTYVQNEPIEFVLTGTNDTDRTIILNYTSSQQYDLYVETSTGNELWRWSEDKLFAPVVSGLTFLPGETKSVSFLWNQKLADDSNLPTGDYVAKGTFFNQTETAQFNFTVQ